MPWLQNPNMREAQTHAAPSAFACVSVCVRESGRLPAKHLSEQKKKIVLCVSPLLPVLCFHSCIPGPVVWEPASNRGAQTTSLRNV